MNTIMQNIYPIFEHYQGLRKDLVAEFTDADLAFRPSQHNESLGQLCREIGEIQVSYIRSLQTFSQNFDYRNETPGLEDSVEMLTAWFVELDQELKEVVAAIPEEDVQNRKVDRGNGFQIAPQYQLMVFQEALLIFYGKVSVYLKAMQKEIPGRWNEWIG